MHTIDIIIVIAYLALCILISLYKSKSIKTLKEYTLGSGSFSDVVIVTTIFATYIGAVSTIGTVEQVHILGLFFAITRLLSPFFWIIMAKIYGKYIDQFRGCISLSDIMEMLYGKTGRWITNIASIILSVAVITLQVTAMGHLLSYFLKIHNFYCAIISILVIAIYSAFGGIRTVALTDVFQFIVLMIAIPMACSFAYHDVGGYEGVMHALPGKMLILDLNRDNVWLFLSLVLYGLLPTTTGTFIQRFLISKNSKQLVRSLYIIACVHFFFALVICAIGFLMKVKVPNIESSTAFIYFIDNYLPIGIKGLLIAGLLAVIMSTADSWLNTTSVLCVHDIIMKLTHLTERQALICVKFITFGISILVVFLSLLDKGIMELEWLGGSFWEPLVLIPLTAGFLKFRTNSKSFIAATTIAILSTSISGYIVGDLATISLMCGMIGSTIGLFGMHYWQVHQGTLNIHTQPTKLTNTAIDEDADRKIAPAESQSRRMFKDEEEKTIANELREKIFIKGIEKGREEVAKNLLLQGLDINIIENATGLSREDLATLQKSIRTAN